MGMTMPELIVSLNKRIIKDGKRIAELEAANKALRVSAAGWELSWGKADKMAEQAEAALVDKQKEVVAALQTAVDMEAERDEADMMLKRKHVRWNLLTAERTIAELEAGRERE